MKAVRGIRQIVEPEVTTDGAGVTLKRLIANSELSDLDPFLLLDHFGSSNPDEYIAGFPMHPHRGIETVTYMLNGLIKHKDSMGNEGVIGPGDIQWMTAGSGIMHEEMPQIREGKMDGFQLWVNLPARKKMMSPRYQDFASDAISVVTTEDGVEVKVIAGEFGDGVGVIRDIETNPTYLDVNIPSGGKFEHAIPSGDTAFAYLFEGSATFGANASDNKGNQQQIFLQGQKLVVFGEGECVRILASDRGARFLLVSGKPLNEPVARYGPFVMNTRAEIQAALADLQNGTFVKASISETG